MIRRVFNLLVLLSLLLCAATVVLWVRSHYRLDEVRFARAGGKLWRFSSAHGQLQLFTWDVWPVSERPRWRAGSPESFPDWGPNGALPGDPPRSSSYGSGVGRPYYRLDGQPPPVGQWEDAFFADEPSFA